MTEIVRKAPGHPSFHHLILVGDEDALGDLTNHCSRVAIM